MPTYLAPGNYVEEKSGGSRSIQGVGTSTLGIVGVAQRHDQHVNVAVPIRNWLHFRREFVDDEHGAPTGEITDLTCGVFGFFQNGGRLCYVVNTGPVDGPVPGAAGSREGVDALDLVDQVAIVAAPGFIDPTSLDRLLTHCENRKDRVAVLDGPARVSDVNQLTKVGTVAVPETPPSQTRRGRVGGTSDGSDSDEATPNDGSDASSGGPTDTPEALPGPEGSVTGYKARDSERGFGAQYVPHIVIANPFDGTPLIAPPSGHIAGVWARTDSERGVFKAPANAILHGVTGFSQYINQAEQELLNPVGCNVLRNFPDRGNVIWGARTVSSDPEWRYLNVRRLFSMVEKSILQDTRWMVFELNNHTLWESIRRDITAFLTRLWRDGALFGRTPEEAFFVKCDEETNPPEVRDAGQVIVVVGIAPVKPAEFVIFQVSQHQAGSTITEGAS